MKKREFLDIVSKFDRNEFREYLYKMPDKKQKLVEVMIMLPKESESSQTDCNR